MLFIFALQSKLTPASSGNSCQELFTHRSPIISWRQQPGLAPWGGSEAARGSEPRPAVEATAELLCSAPLTRLPHLRTPQQQLLISSHPKDSPLGSAPSSSTPRGPGSSPAPGLSRRRSAVNSSQRCCTSRTTSWMATAMPPPRNKAVTGHQKPS